MTIVIFYFSLVFFNLLLLYITNWILIFNLRNEYKEIYKSLGSPSMLSQYPTYIFGLIRSPEFSKIRKGCRINAYLLILFAFSWSITLILFVRSLEG